jgi:acyl carrier protein
MTNHKSRQRIVAAVRSSSVACFHLEGGFQAFIDGGADIELAALALDSLGVMEICIALELDGGLSIEPERLRGLVSMAQLADLLEKLA